MKIILFCILLSFIICNEKGLSVGNNEITADSLGGIISIITKNKITNEIVEKLIIKPISIRETNISGETVKSFINPSHLLNLSDENFKFDPIRNIEYNKVNTSTFNIYLVPYSSELSKLFEKIQLSIFLFNEDGSINFNDTKINVQEGTVLIRTQIQLWNFCKYSSDCDEFRDQVRCCTSNDKVFISNESLTKNDFTNGVFLELEFDIESIKDNLTEEYTNKERLVDGKTIYLPESFYVDNKLIEGIQGFPRIVKREEKNKLIYRFRNFNSDVVHETIYKLHKKSSIFFINLSLALLVVLSILF